MENLQTVLEKILTLNINANTNINIEAIVHQVVLYDMITKITVGVFGGLVIAITVISVAYMVYKSHKLSLEKSVDQKSIEKMREVIKTFGDWRRLEELQSTVKEVLAYMPRNKKPRTSK